MTLMDLRVLTVDTFTQCRFGGNPAAVIPDCDEVPPMYYPQIANELNLPQTAFVHKIADDNYMVEFYTPVEKINFSGHACMAAFFVLADMGYIRPVENGEKKTTVSLSDGVELDVFIRYRDYEVDGIALRIPFSDIVYVDDERVNEDNIAEIIKAPSEKIKLVRAAGTVEKNIIALVEDKATLDSLKPDFWAMKNFNEITDTTGFYVLWADNSKGHPYSYARYFAPKIGLYEEAATGSAAIACGKLILDELESNDMTVYQGQLMKRPSKLEVKTADAYVEVSGMARIVTDGIMRL